MTIGNNIQKYRKLNGITQKELAQRCGYAAGTIQQYELGKREPKFEVLCKIAKNLNTPVEYLIDSVSIGLMTENDVKAIDYFKENIKFFQPYEDNLKYAWEDWLHSNKINFIPWKLNDIEGMLLTFIDINESYFLTIEQVRKLPDLSIEQTKILIKAMGNENVKP